MTPVYFLDYMMLQNVLWSVLSMQNESNNNFDKQSIKENFISFEYVVSIKNVILKIVLT